MTVKLLTKHYLEFLSLKVGCTGLSDSTLVKIPHYWTSRHDSNVNTDAVVSVIAYKNYFCGFGVVLQNLHGIKLYRKVIPHT